MSPEDIFIRLQNIEQKLEYISNHLLKINNDINELKAIIQKRKTKLWQLVGLSFALILFSSILSLI